MWGEENQLDATQCFIALNMFRAHLCPSSGAHDYTASITWRVNPGCWWLEGQVQSSRLCVQGEGCCSTSRTASLTVIMSFQTE